MSDPKRLGLRLALVAAGFAAGGVVFGARSCAAPDEDGHSEPRVQSESQDPAQGGLWTCAMHPQVRASEPGQCPICGMDLIPLDLSDSAGLGGRSRIVWSDRAKTLAQLRTVTVRRQRTGAVEARLLGRVMPDETTLKTVTAWTAGRIDRLHVDATGQQVRAGQVIAVLYSPEVFAAHQDLLVAKKQVQHLGQGFGSALQAARAALEATRERLRLLGVPDDELARMESRTEPIRSVPIRTPFRGTVLERLATEGAYVTTGTPLYRLADLRTVWIQLDAYESDLSRLAVGQAVQIEVDALAEEVFEGKITFIDPTLDAQKRTAQVRVEVANPHGRLRPGAFAEAVVLTKRGSQAKPPLVIPASAPLFTGRRSLVYVEVPLAGRTAYEPRTVRLGPRLDGFYPVVAGLSEGERVVARGAFVLDADLQIRGGDSMMTLSDDRERSAGQGAHSAIDIPQAELRRIAPAVFAYLQIQRALAQDDLDGAREAAGNLADALPSATLRKPPEASVAWSELSAQLALHSHAITVAASIEEARMGFEGLSRAVTQVLQRLGNPLDEAVVLAHCPMALGSQGASWWQRGEELQNAYFGQAMRACGQVEQTVPAGAHLQVPEETAPSRRGVPTGEHRH